MMPTDSLVTEENGLRKARSTASLILAVLGGEPEHQEQRHHGRDEVGVGHFPGAAVMTALCSCS